MKPLKERVFSKSTILGYGVAGIGNAIPAGLFYVYFIFFLTTVAGINPAIAGSISLIAVLWDAINDPMVGFWTDNCKSKYGRRRPFVIGGLLPLTVVIILMFTNLNMPLNFKTAWFILLNILFWFFFTFVDVPMIALGDALAVALMKMRGFTSVDFARLHPGGSLGRRLLMTVGDVMHGDNLPVVAPDCPATQMIHTISKGGLGLIVICDGDRIEGIVTDGDIRRAMERRQSDFFSIRAGDIATRNPKTIPSSEKLIVAEREMTRNKITSLLVTDEGGKLAGVIQIYDIKL